MPLLKTRCSHL